MDDTSSSHVSGEVIGTLAAQSRGPSTEKTTTPNVGAVFFFRFLLFGLHGFLSAISLFTHQHLQRGAKWFLKGVKSPSLRV